MKATIKIAVAVNNAAGDSDSIFSLPDRIDSYPDDYQLYHRMLFNTTIARPVEP